MQIEVKPTYVLSLTQEEYELLYHGIGSTSPNSRRTAGMTEEQAQYFSILFTQLREPS